MQNAITIAALLVGMSATGVAQQPQQPRPAQQQQAQDRARSPQQILQRYTQAVDPEGKLATVKGIRMVSEFTVPAADMKMKMTMAFQRPDRMMVAVESSEGEMKQGFDGTSGWSTEGGTTRGLQPDELARLREGQGLESMGRSMAQFTKVEAAGVRPADGQMADCLKLTWKSGLVSEECYSRETGLIVESRSSQETPQGNIETTTRYHDYEAEEGILIARRLEVQMPGVAQTVTITDVEIGDLDPKLFAAPTTTTGSAATKRP